MTEFVFWVVTSVTIISALGVVLSNQLIYSAISLLVYLIWNCRIVCFSLGRFYDWYSASSLCWRNIDADNFWYNVNQ